MNEQSLAAANDFLRVASATTQPGDFLDRAPTDIGKDAGLPNPLAVGQKWEWSGKDPTQVEYRESSHVVGAEMVSVKLWFDTGWPGADSSA